MRKGILAVVIIASQCILSCSTDDEFVTTPVYTVPDTYNFDNVEYAETASRISMWAGLTSYLSKSASRQISQDTVNFLWNNTNSPFTSETTSNLPFSTDALNGLSFNLSEKSADPATFKAYIDSMVKISQYFNATASEGIPGKIGNRLFNHSGLEFNQAVAKGLMGSMVLSQISVYLDKAASDDNSVLIPGKGTAMEHDWDLAFGYLGIPKDYDSSKQYVNTDPARPLALGGYLRERGQYINAGGIVFGAFRRGRAAIAAKDYAARDQAIIVIKETLEKTLAAAAYAYVTIPQSTSDLAAKFHGLSEAYGFTQALKYRPASSKLSASDYQAMQSVINTNFYELAADASNTKLKQVQDILTTSYGQLQSN